jgi:hypothetical protein
MIREAIPLGTPMADARAVLEKSGFRSPPFGFSCCFAPLPLPYVLTQRVGNVTLRIEVRLFGSDRVEKLDILPGYGWHLPEDALFAD